MQEWEQPAVLSEVRRLPRGGGARLGMLVGVGVDVAGVAGVAVS